MAPEYEYKGLRYRTHTEVYAPHDDTWLLVDAVRSLGSLVDKTVVEVGCGAALGLLAAVAQGATGIGVDRNLQAVRLARDNARTNGLRAGLVQGDLTTAVALDRVDLLLFNPPYLPTGTGERLPGDLNLAFDGGPTGNETLFRFAKILEAAHVAGTALPALVLVTSSLNDRTGVTRRLQRAGYDTGTELGTAAFPFERLYVAHFVPA